VHRGAVFETEGGTPTTVPTRGSSPRSLAPSRRRNCGRACGSSTTNSYREMDRVPLDLCAEG